MKRRYIFFSLILLASMSEAQVTQQDSLTLVALYNATSGPEWLIDSNWLSDKPVATWHGIQVSAGRVTGIEFSYNQLEGTLPEEIGQLTGLTYLILYANALTGTLPPSLGSLSNLETLNLTSNKFNGTIPETFANLDRLFVLNLYKNEFSGPFPQVVFQMDSLTRLDLGVNQFSGAIPPEINQLTRLTSLGLEENAFSGVMPSIKALTNLSDLYLYRNQLSGDVSDFLGHYPNMWYIKLDENDFTGCISDTFFNPQRMQFLDFRHCNISCLGDFSQYENGGAIRRINARDNKLPFEVLETSIGLVELQYAPQQPLLEPDTIIVQPGDTIEIASGSGGMYTQYQWFHDGESIPGETQATLSIIDFSGEDAGVYTCEMTNDSLPDLTLTRSPVTLQQEGPSALSAPDVLPLEIYPNPVTDVIHLPHFADGRAIRIIDASGKIVLQQTQSVQNGTLPVQTLPAGVYAIIVTTHAEVYVAKFIKTPKT